MKTIEIMYKGNPITFTISDEVMNGLRNGNGIIQKVTLQTENRLIVKDKEFCYIVKFIGEKLVTKFR